MAKSFLAVVVLAATAAAADPDPLNLVDWSVGWAGNGGGDGAKEEKLEKMLHAAQTREKEARKELAQAREDEKQQESKHLRGKDGKNEEEIESAELDAARQEARHQKQLADAAQREAEIYMERASAAEARAKSATDMDDQQKAERMASHEANLANQAANTAKVKKLEAKIAHDKVRFLEVQSLNGSLFGNHLVLAGGAVLLLSLCVCLLKKPNQKDGLSAPLLEEPEWTNDSEAGIEDWRQRALKGLEEKREAKLQFEEQLADANQRVAHAQKEMDATKQENSDLKAQLSQQENAVKEQKENAAKEQQDHRGDLATVQQENTDLKSQLSEQEKTMKQLKDREDELSTAQVVAQAEIGSLREQLELSQTSLKRVQVESASAQAALHTAEQSYQEAMSKVGLNEKGQMLRADEAESLLQETKKELEEVKKQAAEAHQKSQNDLSRGGSVQILEYPSTIQIIQEIYSSEICSKLFQ